MAKKVARAKHGYIEALYSYGQRLSIVVKQHQPKKSKKSNPPISGVIAPKRLGTIAMAKITYSATNMK